MDPRISIAIDLINANLYRKLSLSELAASANLSCSHFCCLFKTQIGRPPGQFIKMLRLQKARELLEDSPRSVKQIMATVGYNDKSDFCHDFRKVYGHTPLQHRKSYPDLTLSEDFPKTGRS